MENSDKNSERLNEIEKEVANLNEKKSGLEAKFKNEKAVFNGISEAKNR